MPRTGDTAYFPGDDGDGAPIKAISGETGRELECTILIGTYAFCAIIEDKEGGLKMTEGQDFGMEVRLMRDANFTNEEKASKATHVWGSSGCDRDATGSGMARPGRCCGKGYPLVALFSATQIRLG